MKRLINKNFHTQIDPYLGNFDYESYTKYENGKGGDKILSSSTHVDGLPWCV